MKGSKGLSLFFLFVGAVLIAAALVPVFQKPPQLPSMPFLITGIVVAVFGGLIYPSGGAGPALQQLVIVAKDLPIVGAMVGGKRATDPPATPPAEPPSTPPTGGSP